jgi:hypothetical protein
MDILQNHKPRTRLHKRLTIEYIGYILLLLYIFTMPFVSAFSFTGTISLPLIFSVFLFMLMIVKMLQSGKLPPGFLGFDILIILLLLLLISFSFTINGWGNSKSFNHTVAYLSTFLLFYLSVKFILFDITDKNKLFKRVLKVITYITIISAVYANIEFISSNVFAINLNDYIPRPTEAEAFYNATVLGSFYRARGFAPESGHFAFMMELFGPLAIYYMYFSGFCKWNKFLKALIATLILLSIIFTVSTASFVIIPLAVFFALLFYLKSIYIYIKKNTAKFVLSSIAVSVVVLLFNYYLSFYALIILSISDKMDSNSFDDRQNRINFFYDNFSRLNFIHKLVGTGPAGYTILGFDEFNTILSLFYSVTFELGLLGLLLFLLLFFYIIYHAIKIKSTIRFFLIVAIISGTMHYYFISNFWYPWFWFIAAFTIFCSKQNSYLLKVYKKSENTI